MWDSIKEGVSAFFGSSILTKILIFISAWMNPTWELYLLLIFLCIVDFIMDLSVWFINKSKEIKSWHITKPFVVKLIMYSVLVIVLNAVQQHLVKEAFEIFKLVMAIPIIAELLGIVGTVERYTGIQIVAKLKSYLDNWINSKTPNKD